MKSQIANHKTRTNFNDRNSKFQTDPTLRFGHLQRGGLHRVMKKQPAPNLDAISGVQAVMLFLISHKDFIFQSTRK